MNQFVQSVLIPECKSGGRKFLLGALVGTGKLSHQIVPAEAAKMLGIVDADGNIDTDVLRQAALGGINAAGELYVGLLGLHFTKPDIEKFLTFIEKGIVG